MLSIDLSGMSALVVGGGRGIGRAISIALAQAGTDVAVCSRTSYELGAVKKKIEEMNRRAVAIPCDVTDSLQIDRMVKEVLTKFGSVQILVLCAGIAAGQSFLNHPDALWDRSLAVNLSSAYYISKAFVPSMIGHGHGRIIMIASIAAKIPLLHAAGYTVSKHSLLGLMRAMARDLAVYGLTVNAVCPGYSDTDLTQARISNSALQQGISVEEAKGQLEQVCPQQRLIDPDEVAALAVFLSSEAARGITGQAINVDGGAVML